MNEQWLAEIRRNLTDGYTGQITLHVQNGTIQNVEKLEKLRPRDLKRMELIEDAPAHQ